ncbi:MAG: DUF4298 domain-containing protein [Bacteroidales bacterium]|nr:DUF4298 domain-containing protein [Bacteroidales bacterium]
MENNKYDSILTALMVCASTFAVVAYFLGNRQMFMIAGSFNAGLILVWEIYAHLLNPVLDRTNVWNFIMYIVLYLAIGCLIEREDIFSGLLLGVAFMGLGSTLVDRLTRWTAGPRALDGQYDYDADLDNLENWETFRADEKADPAERVRTMSQAYERTCGVVDALNEDLSAFEKDLETMEELKKYHDSGLMEKDCMTEEVHRLPESTDPYSVLAEGTLRTLLLDIRDLKERLRTFRDA